MKSARARTRIEKNCGTGSVTKQQSTGGSDWSSTYTCTTECGCPAPYFFRARCARAMLRDPPQALQTCCSSRAAPAACGPLATTDWLGLALPRCPRRSKYFVKTSSRESGMFDAEAAGLR